MLITVHPKRSVVLLACLSLWPVFHSRDQPEGAHPFSETVLQGGERRCAAGARHLRTDRQTRVRRTRLHRGGLSGVRHPTKLLQRARHTVSGCPF